MKAHILIVEDEALLYRRMKKALEKENYTVDTYTPSVDEAVAVINKKRPDLVLLDIQLKGNLTGLDLGKKLHEIYKIPFIYITDFDDNQSFYNALSTHHEHFMVKTKPHLDTIELLRVIETVIQRYKDKSDTDKNAIIGLLDYLDNLKSYAKGTITRVPIMYEDIAMFSIASFVGENDKLEELQSNYLWFLTKSDEYYFVKKSLNDLYSILPHYFVRINKSHIVNISPKILLGRVNGSRLSIMNQELTVSDTYRKEFEKRFKLLYHT